jgi:superfamily II DNA or RNA helicase
MNLKRTYNSIIKKSGIEDREYQKDFLTNEIYQNPKLPIVLGAGTSSGKTVMAILKLIMFYLNPKNKNKQTLIIPAFQEILRDNFVEQLKEIRIMYGVLPFTYKIVKGRDSKEQIKEAIDNGVNVIICLPTTVNNHSSLFKNKIEWLYVDEAQYYYLAKMCKDMIKAIKPKYQLLMTGSVAKYNANSNDYIIKYVPVAELHRLGLVSNPRIELVQSSYDLKDTDYKSMFGNLKDGKTNSIAKNIQSLHSVAKEMVLTLKNRFPNLVTNKYYGKRAIRIFGDIDKTIMICHSIPQANCFHKILFKELKGKVLISHSERPKDEMNMFNKFKTDDSKLLIVVNQGRIGYSMKELFNIVDFSMSKDFEIIQQIVGRLLRISELQPNKQKIYYKVSTTDLAKWYEYVMRCVMCLMHLEWYSTYKGDKKQFKFPYMVRNQNQSITKTKSNSKSKSNNRFKISDEFPMDLDYVNYVEQNMKSEFATYAWWNLEDVLKEDFNKKSLNYNKTKEDILKDASKYNLKQDWVKNNSANVAYAVRHGWLEEATAHMKVGWSLNPITNKELKELASKFETKADFCREYRNYEGIAKRRGIWDDITKHMRAGNIKWTLDRFYDYVKKNKLKNKQDLRNAKGVELRKIAYRLGVWNDFPNAVKK